MNWNKFSFCEIYFPFLFILVPSSFFFLAFTLLIHFLYLQFQFLYSLPYSWCFCNAMFYDRSRIPIHWSAFVLYVMDYYSTAHTSRDLETRSVFLLLMGRIVLLNIVLFFWYSIFILHNGIGHFILFHKFICAHVNLMATKRTTTCNVTRSIFSQHSLVEAAQHKHLDHYTFIQSIIFD